jgi:hypothetical protein
VGQSVLVETNTVWEVVKECKIRGNLVQLATYAMQLMLLGSN